MLINLNLFCKIHGIEKFRELHAGTFHGKKKHIRCISTTKCVGGLSDAFENKDSYLSA